MSCVRFKKTFFFALPNLQASVPFFLLLRNLCYASFSLVGNLSSRKDCGQAAMTDKETSLSTLLTIDNAPYSLPLTRHGVIYV